MLKFQDATKRLYYFDTSDCEVEETMLISTTADNKKRLSAQDFPKAKIARALQHRSGRPTTKDFIHYVTANIVPKTALLILFWCKT